LRARDPDVLERAIASAAEMTTDQAIELVLRTAQPIAAAATSS